MSNQTGSTSSNTNGSTPARLLSDPSLTTCPDFSSAAFQAIRLAVDPDDAAAITQLTNSWQQDIDRLKAQWAAQAEADKHTQEVGGSPAMRIDMLSPGIGVPIGG